MTVNRRLTQGMPGIFPSTVLSRALERPFVPPTPRIAIDSYWRAHQFALIVWPARSLPQRGATAGPGGLARTAVVANIPDTAGALSRTRTH